jgi:UTP--glucose-1-phosphate uridylyltransferase
MADVFSAEGAACVIAVEEVRRAAVPAYGIVKPGAVLRDGIFRIEDVVEKPSPETAPSNLAIAARYVFAPDIYPALERTRPGKGGEIQLTDAIRILLEEGKKVLGVRLGPGEARYDIGNFESYFEAFVEFALADPQLGPGFRAFLLRYLPDARA